MPYVLLATRYTAGCVEIASIKKTSPFANRTCTESCSRSTTSRDYNALTLQTAFHQYYLYLLAAAYA